jgi:hypothetical protein
MSHASSVAESRVFPPVTAGRFLLACWLVTAAQSALVSAEEPPLGPCAVVVKAGFYDEKLHLGQNLGKRKTPEVKECLLSLLELPSSWDREAAVSGLFALDDSSVAGVLIEKMLSDHMVREEIARGFHSAPRLYFAPLREALRLESTSERRAILLSALAAPSSSDAERMLRELVADTTSPDRLPAFELLATRYPDHSDAFIRGQLQDPLLRPVVLGYLLEHGSLADLDVFRHAALAEDDRTAALGLRGVSRFGDPATKEEALLQALSGPRESRTQAALLLLPGAHSVELRRRLCQAVTAAAEPSTRVLSADYLASWNEPEVVPCLIPALKEGYAPPPRGVADVVGSVLTAGVLGVLSDTVNLLNKKDFESRKRHIAERLPALTGADPGPGYEAWLTWAVCRGYTVDGVNVLQRLFAPNAATRRAAVDCACVLLGYPETARERARQITASGEHALLLDLAGRLLDRGILETAP